LTQIDFIRKRFEEKINHLILSQGEFEVAIGIKPLKKAFTEIISCYA